MRRLRTAGLILSLLIGTPAGATVIDFDDLTGTGINFNRGYTYAEDGYVLDHLGTSDPFASVHPGDFRYYGSTHFWNNHPGEVTRLTRSGGGLFNLESIDLNSLNGDYAVGVTFTGLIDGGGSVTQSFTTDGLPGFETFMFDNTFRNLTEVSWVQADPYHYFDNIVTAVPEPSTMALLAAAFGGLVAAQRRKPA